MGFLTSGVKDKAGLRYRRAELPLWWAYAPAAGLVAVVAAVIFGALTSSSSSDQVDAGVPVINLPSLAPVQNGVSGQGGGSQGSSTAPVASTTPDPQISESAPVSSLQPSAATEDDVSIPAALREPALAVARAFVTNAQEDWKAVPADWPVKDSARPGSPNSYPALKLSVLRATAVTGGKALVVHIQADPDGKPDLLSSHVTVTFDQQNGYWVGMIVGQE